MGRFWGSVHVRCEQRDAALLAAVEALAAQRGLRFYVGPAINGWIAIYPSEHGQDTSVAEQLARSVPQREIFHLLLHDEDVFAYNFYRDGALVDDYVSTPGYFSEKDRAAEEAMEGHPARYADLLKRPPLEVKALLARRDDADIGDPFEEAERFEKFAKALGIANAATSYEYIEEGEAGPLKFRRQFVHIPDRGEEKRVAARERDAHKQHLKELKSRGILPADYRVATNGWILAAADARSGGFLLRLAKMPFQDPEPLLSAAPPWPKKPPPIDLLAGRVISAFTLDRSGDFLAAACDVHPKTQLEIWKVPQRRRIAQFPGFAHQLHFSHDSSRLIVVHDQVRVIEVDTGRVAHAFASRGATRAILHPSNNQLLIDEQTHLRLIDLASGADRPLYPGGSLNVAGGMMSLIDQFERQARAAIEKKIGAGEDGAERRARMEQPMQKQLALMREAIERAKSDGGGRATGPQQAIERVAAMQFTADGTMLLAATHFGLRIYDWNAILASPDGQMRRAKHAFQSTQKHADGIETQSQMVAVAQDEISGRVFFGGSDGVLYALDLADGRVSSFLEMPRRAMIIQIDIPRGGETIGTLCRPNLSDPRRSAAPTYYVWNRAALARSDPNNEDPARKGEPAR